jgi:hypothetical protein
MNQRDLELLSSYLDGQLRPSESARLENRLKTDPQLASVLSDLRATRTLLRKLPQRRAPRNFTLTRKMVGQNPPLPKAYPFFRLATALATLLFVFSFGLNSVGRMAAQVPAGGFGGGGGAAESTELYAEGVPAATQAPAEEAPAQPSLQLVPAPTTTASAANDMARAAETATLKSGEELGTVNQNQVQRESYRPPVQFPLQIALGAVAALGAIIMLLMRRLAAGRWR